MPVGAEIVMVPVGVVQEGCAVTLAVGVAGNGFTVTVTFLVCGQPVGVELETVYVVVVEGLAVTLAPEVALKLVDGLQEYIPLPPEAVKDTD